MGPTFRVLNWRRAEHDSCLSNLPPPIFSARRKLGLLAGNFLMMLFGTPMVCYVFVWFYDVFTQPLQTIVYATMLTVFRVFRTNYKLRSPLDIIVTAARFLFYAFYCVRCCLDVYTTDGSESIWLSCPK